MVQIWDLLISKYILLNSINKYNIFRFIKYITFCFHYEIITFILKNKEISLLYIINIYLQRFKYISLG